MDIMNSQAKKLVGLLNNSRVGEDSNNSFAIEDTLYSIQWESDQENFIYKYQNSLIDNSYYIQIIPKFTKEEKEAISEAGIDQNIIVDSEVSKTIFNIYAKKIPSIDINVTIIATKIK